MLAIFCTSIFLTGGVYTPYSPCMSTPLAYTTDRPPPWNDDCVKPLAGVYKFIYDLVSPVTWTIITSFRVCEYSFMHFWQLWQQRFSTNFILFLVVCGTTEGCPSDLRSNVSSPGTSYHWAVRNHSKMS